MGTLVFQANLGGAVNLIGPNTASTVNFTLPSADGTSGQALVTNGSGTLSFSTFTSGAAGSNTQVQFNSSGAFAGSANLTFDGTTLTSNALTVTNATTLSAGTANGVAYLNGSKVVTTGSALTFDGTTLKAAQGSSGATAASNGNTLVLENSAAVGMSLLSPDANASRIYFGTASNNRNAFIYSDYNAGAQTLIFGLGSGATAATEQMRLTSTGLGIGTSSPGAKLDVSGFARTTLGAVFQGASNLATGAGLEIGYNASSQGYIQAFNRTASTYQPVKIIGSQILFDLSNTVSMTLDSSGNLGLGVTPSAWISTNKAFQFGYGAVRAFSNSANTYLDNNNYVNSSGTDIYLNNGFAGRYRIADNQHIWYQAASGTAGNAITFTQAMTLDASGNLGVGTTSPAVKLDSYGAIRSTLAADTNYYAELTNSGGATQLKAVGTGATMQFFVTGSERARIDSSGNLLVGTTSATGLGVGTAPVQSAGSIFSGGTNAGFAFKDRGASTFSLWYKTGGVNYFYTSGAGANVASINETTGAYTALSDVSKKKDFEESMIGLDTVMQLQPKLFRMLSDEDTAPKQLGFIAQDVKSVLPQAYVEQKDEDNTFIGLQDRPFIAALVKAIQEQQALITQLTERITALEFK